MAYNPARPNDPIGWPLMPVPDAGGSLNWPDLETSIRETIRATLVTRPGERRLHPQFGGALQDFVHQPNTVLTRKRIHDRVGETLGAWEPRIALTAITVEPEGEFGERVRITVDYRIRRRGQTAALSVALKVAGD